MYFTNARGVVTQIKRSVSFSSALASVIGLVFGSIVPVSTFVLSRELTLRLPNTQNVYESLTVLSSQVVSYVVLGGLVYSALTVYSWASLAFGNPLKAIGFVVLLEGTMMFSSHLWLNLLTLCYLVFINGTATACKLAEDETREIAAEEEEMKEQRIQKKKLRSLLLD